MVAAEEGFLFFFSQKDMGQNKISLYINQGEEKPKTFGEWAIKINFFIKKKKISKYEGESSDFSIKRLEFKAGVLESKPP